MADVAVQKANTKAMRIHGKWYDVENFDHPGGPIMLSLGKGRDATGLFEVCFLPLPPFPSHSLYANVGAFSSSSSSCMISQPCPLPPPALPLSLSLFPCALTIIVSPPLYEPRTP